MSIQTATGTPLNVKACCKYCWLWKACCCNMIWDSDILFGSSGRVNFVLSSELHLQNFSWGACFLPKAQQFLIYSLPWRCVFCESDENVQHHSHLFQDCFWCYFDASGVSFQPYNNPLTYEQLVVVTEGCFISSGFPYQKTLKLILCLHFSDVEQWCFPVHCLKFSFLINWIWQVLAVVCTLYHSKGKGF